MQASVSIEVGRRIYRRAVDANLKVAMAAGGAPGGTGLGDGLPLIDLVTRRDQQAGIVSVIGLLAVAMVDDDQVAITALVPRKGDGTAVRSLYRGAVGNGDIQSGVVTVRAENGAVAKAGCDAPIDWPDIVPCGIPGGPLFGPDCDDLLRGLPQDSGRGDVALLFHTVDISHVGGHQRLAGDTGIQHLGLALIHAVVLHFPDLAGDLLMVGEAVHRLHPQEGDLLFDVQDLADIQLVDVDTGVKLLHLGHGHIIVEGQSHKGIALLNLVGQ